MTLKYKLMAVDVDGTLLDSSDRISERTKRAVNCAIDKGLIFTISSGRPIQGVRPIIGELGFTKDMPFICYNGAMLVMGLSGEILFEKPLSAENSKKIYELGQSYGTTVMIWTDNRLYANRIDERAVKYGIQAHATPEPAQNIDKLLENGATKLLWYDETDIINEYQKKTRDIFGDEINIHTSKPYFLEFVDSGASKAIAMQKLAEHFGIDRSRMIAVGDGLNDISMISYAGLGVAMGNSDPEVIKKADLVTLSNDDDGVALIIEKFILNKKCTKKNTLYSY
ncbi:MAG: Cof-type HAD-IIB family hydrolase [Eubacteriales bacterium]|nr:Cof-type HAD-IIB family hydrolase [Eubacteriales bacterium]